MTLIDYVTLSTMKTYLGIDADTKYDALLSEAITSASREVERRCGRVFNKDSSASARTFDCEISGMLFVDDISTSTGVLIDGVALTSDDTLFPRNGIVSGQTGHPYTRIKSDTFIEGEEYAITATWGWPSIPDTIVSVTRAIAAETYMARVAPLGIQQDPVFGPIRLREQVQITNKLRHYKKNVVGML